MNDKVIVFPWLNKDDWTSSLFSYFSEKNVAEIRVCEYDVSFENFNFLNNKNNTTNYLLNQVGLENFEVLILIDVNFIDLRQIKLKFPHIKITGIINGGDFQNFGFSALNNKEIHMQLKNYEKANLSFLNTVVLPSEYAKKYFLMSYPSFSNVTISCYFPIPYSTLKQYKNHKDKSYNICFCSRGTYERGVDVAAEVNEKITVDFIRKQEKSIYLEKLSNYKYSLYPSREELFGYSVIESLLVGTIPLIPYEFSYKELIDLPYYIDVPNSTSILKVIDLYNDMSFEERDVVVLNAVNSLVSQIKTNSVDMIL